MKKLLLLLFTVLLSTSLFAQRTFFDANWEKVETAEEATYYRIASKDKTNDKLYIVEDFYMSDKKQWLGKMSSLDPEVVEGYGVYWYENGNKEAAATYVKGKLVGLVEYWHENGQLKWKCKYKDGKRNGIRTEWYENGKKKAKIKYVMGEEKKAKYWDENGEKMAKPEPKPMKE